MVYRPLADTCTRCGSALHSRAPLSLQRTIAWLLAVGQHRALSAHKRQLMLEIVEFIGRWSMIDVFVVAILSALVQLDSVATINPGIAAVYFALSVVFTMLAALSLDSRLIWDGNETGNETGT